MASSSTAPMRWPGSWRGAPPGCRKGGRSVSRTALDVGCTDSTQAFTWEHGVLIKQKRTKALTHACRHSAWYLNSLSMYKHFPVLLLRHHSGSNSFTKEGFLLLSVVYRLSWYQCREGNMTTQVMFLSLGNISGFPNKSSRNAFAIYSFKAATIVIQVKDMKESYQP